jgi:hypothetical protein
MRDRDDKLRRRTMLAGAGTVGALAAAATLLVPGREQTVAAKTGPEQPAADSAQGYRLTEHVKRYYRTARV